jgi:hypothetical protein
MTTKINATTTSGVIIQPDNSGILELQTNSGTTAVTIDTSQNVGIGTSSPSQKLSVAGAITATSYFIPYNGATALGYIGNDNSISGGTGTNLGIRSETAINFATGGSTERMRIDSTGNVGIGTTSPSTYSAALVSKPAASVAALAIDAASGNNTGINWYNNGSIKWGTQVLTTNEYRFYDFTASAERMRIDNAGNVLVSTNTLYGYQAAPTSKAAAATLTGAELIVGILNTTGTTYTITLPTGTNIDAAVSTSLAANGSFEWVVINTASGTITIGANGNTTMGTLTVATGVSARFRFRKTAANTYTVYRI